MAMAKTCVPECKKVKSYTVKLGYNELGYNKHSVITNKKVQSQMTILPHKTTRL